MIKKDYLFFDVDGEKFKLLDGTTSQETTHEISQDEFYQESKDEVRQNTEPLTIFEQISQAYNTGHKIYFKKDQKFYKLEKNEFIRIYQPRPLASEEDENKRKKKFLLTLNQSRYTQLRISGNLISVGGNSQYGPEFSWVPYFKFSNTSGIAAPLALSTYATEDNNLQKTTSLGIKAQFIGRHYISRLFLEGGGGIHYFKDYEDASIMLTLGSGYVFKNPYWIFSEKIFLSGLSFHASQIFWRKSISEYKLGIIIVL